MSEPNPEPGTRERGQGAQMLLTAACVVVVVAGAKAAASILVPILFAGLLSILCLPPIRGLRRFGVPGPIAVLLVIVGALMVVLFFTGIIGDTIPQFREALPGYKERVEELGEQSVQWLAETFPRIFGDLTFRTVVPQDISPGRALEFIGNTTGAAMGLASDLAVVLLIMMFGLFEASALPQKLRRAIGRPDADLAVFERVASQVQGYLAIKTAVSALTGALVWLLAWSLEIDFPALWALVAFLFNYVPNIGSIIAAFPAVLLALVQHGFGVAGLAILGYLVINILVGNFLEPRWMGKRLGLSTLVVFLSLLVWSWVFGPVGMLLSVPLTVILKIVLESTDDFQAIAVLLGPADGASPSPRDSRPRA